MQPADYLKLPYARVIRPDSAGGYSAEIPEFRGCIAEGNTAEEALQNLERAGESWIEACLEQGLQIPRPMGATLSGRVALRLPRSLHHDAARYAESDGVSLNQFIVAAVAEKVGRASALIRISSATLGPIPGFHFRHVTSALGSGYNVSSGSVGTNYFTPLDLQSGTVIPLGHPSDLDDVSSFKWRRP